MSSHSRECAFFSSETGMPCCRRLTHITLASPPEMLPYCYLSRTRLREMKTYLLQHLEPNQSNGVRYAARASSQDNRSELACGIASSNFGACEVLSGYERTGIRIG